MSTPQDNPRRQSFLDIGGANSINNFKSSFQRASSYVELALADTVALELSPCTSADATYARDAELAVFFEGAYGGVENVRKHGDRVNQNYQFAPDENHPLVGADGDELGSLRRLSGTSLSTHFGGSTAPQTIFNSINTLMGVGMLSLPFAFNLCGWVLSSVLLAACAWSTGFTAKILGKILKKHRSAHTYGDIAQLFGARKFHAFATFLFTLDLLGAVISLILLFADSFTILLPQVPTSYFKLGVVAITFAMSFLPLSVVSLISVVGILCTVGIVACITAAGVFFTGTAGSILHPVPTNLWPKSLMSVFFSLGMFMSPWGGHPIFPELYRDMRHPAKFNDCCDFTFLSVFILDYIIALMGYLMFGSNVADSLTKNLMSDASYPAWFSPLLCVLLGLLPISKLALVARPIISAYEKYLPAENGVVYKNGKRIQQISWEKFVARIFFAIFVFVLSLVFTSFGQVVALFGSAICFTICLTFPLIFHLKFNGDELSTFLKILTWAGIFIGVAGAILGTVGSLANP